MPGSFVRILDCAPDVAEFHLTDEHHVREGFHFFFVVCGGQGLGGGVFLFFENGIFRYFGIGILLNVEDLGKLGRDKFSEKKWDEVVGLSRVTNKRVFSKSKIRIGCFATLFLPGV